MPTICVNCKNCKWVTEEELADRNVLIKFIDIYDMWGMQEPEKRQRDYILTHPYCAKFKLDYILGFYHQGPCHKKNTDGNCPDYEEKENEQ